MRKGGTIMYQYLLSPEGFGMFLVFEGVAFSSLMVIFTYITVGMFKEYKSL